MISISAYDKVFYKIDYEDSYKIVLESTLEKDDLFSDIMELLKNDSEFISKIIINKSLKEHFESQIQINVSKSKIELIEEKIKKLNYKELGEVN